MKPYGITLLLVQDFVSSFQPFFPASLDAESVDKKTLKHGNPWASEIEWGVNP